MFPAAARQRREEPTAASVARLAMRSVSSRARCRTRLGLVENEPPASRPWQTTTRMRKTPMTRTTNLDPFWVFARARDRPDVLR